MAYLVRWVAVRVFVVVVVVVAVVRVVVQGARGVVAWLYLQ